VPNLNDITARHAHFIEQFKNGQVKNFMPFLNRVAKGMRAELLKTDTVRSRSRIESKLVFVDALINKEFKTYSDDLGEQLVLFAEEEAEC
jgi:hypothetical protein